MIMTILLKYFLNEDEYSSAIPMDFDFQFFGNTYSELYINQNGFLTFDTPGGETTWDPQFLPDTTAPNNLIAGIWHDIDASFCDPYYGGCITYETLGVAPNRRFVVSFYGSDFCYGYHDVQIKLYETTNVIEIHAFYFDGYCGPATMGIEDDIGNEAIVVPDRNASSDWFVDFDEPIVKFVPAIDDDAGILTNLTSYCAGLQDIRTVVQNFGSNDITSLTVNWSWNGVTQTPVILDPTLFVPGQAGVVTLGQQTLIQGVRDTLEVWTSLPNGMPDGNPSNDAQSSFVSPGMQGSYTIGGASPDFATFGEAVAALQDTGICDTVWMLVRPGTYTEQVEIGSIPGAGSSDNVVIFTAENGDSSSVTLQFASTAFDENYVLRFVNGHHVIWENMTLQSLGGTYTRVIELLNFSFDNIIQSCALVNQPTTSSSTSRATVYSGEGSYRNTIRHNTLEFGTYGIYHSDYSQLTQDNLIENNSFEQFRNYGIYMEFVGSMDIRGNSIVSGQSSATGIYLDDVDESIEVSHNEVFLSNGNDGMVIYSNVSSPDSTLVFNNNIQIGGASSTSMGISAYGNYVDCVNNSINITATTTSSRAIQFNASNSRLLNNILVNTGGGQGIYLSASGSVVDHNAYYVTGSIFGEFNSTSNDIFSYEEWLEETAVDSSSIFANPFFTSETDLHTNNNALNGKGVPVSYITIDFDGEPRDPVLPDIGSDEFMPTDDDVATVAFLSPVSGCDTLQDVEVVISNIGGNAVSQVNIDWSVNGVAQSGVLLTQTLSPEGDTAHVNLGPTSFNEAIDTIVVWTSMPNGNADSSPLNDTISLIYRTALEGVFTVGGMTPDFDDLSDAFELMSHYSICGPVSLQLRDGTYNGQWIIDSIPGASSVNTITIESESGDSSAVVLEATGLTSNSNYVFRISEADYLTFRNLTFYTGGNSLYSAIFDINGGVTRFTLEHCRLEGLLNASFSDLVDANGPGNNYFTFTNNTFIGGTNGIDLFGFSSVRMDSTAVVNNEFYDQSNFSIDLNNQRDLFVIDNLLVDEDENANDMSGMDITNIVGNNVIAGNEVRINYGGQGVYLGSVNNFVGQTGNTLIYNNFIYTSSGMALRVWNSVRAHIYFNNVYASGPFTNDHALEVEGGDSIRIKNNVLVSPSALTIKSTSSSPAYSEIDHNNMFTSEGTTLANWNNTPYADLTAWQGAGFDLNGLSVDPQFVAGNDLHVLSSELNGAAQPIAGITIDIDGDTRDVINPDIGADEIGVGPDDAGIVTMFPKMPFANGTQQIEAVIRNYGSNVLSTASIAWEVNGVPQTTYNYSGALASLAQDTVILGSVDFEFATEYDFDIWTSLPNGNADTDPANDTLDVNDQYSAVSGNLTIGGDDPDIDSISSAIAAMTVGGVLDSVTFDIRPGIYDEVT